MTIPSHDRTIAPENSTKAWLWATRASAAGIVLAVVGYLYRKDLWLDEAMLALNVMDRDFAGLLRPLDLGQAAPVGYLWLLKVCVLAGGLSEYALRAPSLLAQIGLLLLLPRLCRRWLPEFSLLPPIATAVVALHPGLLAYALMAKPYAIDVWVAVAVPWLTFWAAEGEWRGVRLLFAVVIFGLLPWFSFASVFVLGGVGGAELVRLVMQRRWGESMRATAGYAVAGASFLASYLLFVRSNPVRGVLLEMDINRHFLSLSFWRRTTWTEWGEHAGLLFGQQAGVPAAMAGLSALVILVAVFALGSQRRLLRSAWLAGPILLVAVAAAAHLYPLMNRTILFLVPAVVLSIAVGLSVLAETGRTAGLSLAWLAGALLFAAPWSWMLVRAVRPLADEGLSTVMREVSAYPVRADCLVIDSLSTPVFTLYNRWRHYESVAPVVGADGFDDSWEKQQARLDALPAGTTVWMILPETSIGPAEERHRAEQYLRRRGRVLAALERLDSAAYLIELTSGSAAATPRS